MGESTRSPTLDPSISLFALAIIRVLWPRQPSIVAKMSTGQSDLKFAFARFAASQLQFISSGMCGFLSHPYPLPHPHPIRSDLIPHSPFHLEHIQGQCIPVYAACVYTVLQISLIKWNSNKGSCSSAVSVSVSVFCCCCCCCLARNWVKSRLVFCCSALKDPAFRVCLSYLLAFAIYMPSHTRTGYLRLS